MRLVDVYDFAPFATVVDVGGGYGDDSGGRACRSGQPRRLTGCCLCFRPAACGRGCRGTPRLGGVADRCARLGGDFFEAVPSGGDAYVLSQILHDWDDERCLDILRQCRRVMPEHGKLLVVEIVLAPGEEPSFGKWLDLHMLAVTGGRERTASEYDSLFRSAGFALAHVLATPAGLSVLEAVPI